MNESTKLMIIVGGVAVVAYIAYKAVPKVAAAVGDAAQAVNPLNHDNVIAGAANKVGGIIAGDESGNWTLGGWIYDLTHKAYDPNDLGPARTNTTAPMDKYSRPPVTSGAFDGSDAHLYRQGTVADETRASDVNPFDQATYVFGA
ncbi:MAG: hypothetical protein ABI433_07175 [Burkholderiaceae bacterium]